MSSYHILRIALVRLGSEIKNTQVDLLASDSQVNVGEGTVRDEGSQQEVKEDSHGVVEDVEGEGSLGVPVWLFVSWELLLVELDGIS